MSFRDRLIRGVPVWRRIVERSTGFFRQTAVSGGAAGVIVVADIKKGDRLISVIEVAATSAALADRTAEFLANEAADGIVTQDGQINNTGGTATTGDGLIVAWEAFAE